MQGRHGPSDRLIQHVGLMCISPKASGEFGGQNDSRLERVRELIDRRVHIRVRRCHNDTSEVS